MADAQLALTHQITITLGGQVLSENWPLLITLKRKCLKVLWTPRCPKILFGLQILILTLFQASDFYFFVCAFSLLCLKTEEGVESTMELE